jgi:hypothetical protein
MNIDILIDNPNIIFIDSVKINNNKMIINKNNKTLKCSINNINETNPTLNIFATCLFGNDTITNLNFSNLIINDENELENPPPLQIIISKNHNHLYTRIAKINNIYPSPCK